MEILHSTCLERRRSAHPWLCSDPHVTELAQTQGVCMRKSWVLRQSQWLLKAAEERVRGRMACVRPSVGRKGTPVFLSAPVLLALCRGNTVVMSSRHNNEEKWTWAVSSPFLCPELCWDGVLASTVCLEGTRGSRCH